MEDVVPEIPEDKPMEKGSQASRAQASPIMNSTKGTIHQSIFTEAGNRRQDCESHTDLQHTPPQPSDEDSEAQRGGVSWPPSWLISSTYGQVP